MLGWLRRWRQWNAEHVRAWAGYDVPGMGGLTPFQVRCESALTEHLARRGVALTARRVAGIDERYIWAQLADSDWSVFIHRDQAELSGPGSAAINIEQWDALTPADLVAKYLQHVDVVLDGLGAPRAS
jgi:hypothetical protein